MALRTGAGRQQRQRASRPGVRSQEKLSAVLETIPQGELLLRGDSVAFPPGGCAFLHKHGGPGIRCLIDGGIRIDTHGRSTSYGPGSAWYETGSDPVFAQAATDRPSRFIRVMVLPRSLLGKSSFQFVNEEDKAKPRVQQYKIFVDVPIATPKDVEILARMHCILSAALCCHYTRGDTSLEATCQGWQTMAAKTFDKKARRGGKTDEARTKRKARKAAKRKDARPKPQPKADRRAVHAKDGHDREPPRCAAARGETRRLERNR